MRGQAANWDYQWGEIVGRAWVDEAFKARLLAGPMAALKEYDLTVPEGVRLQVLEDPDTIPEDTNEVFYLVLPGRPPAEDLSEEELCGVGGDVITARCGCERCSCERCSCERCSCERCSCERCRCDYAAGPRNGER